MQKQMRFENPKEKETAMQLARNLATRHLDINRSPILINAIHARHELLSEVRAFFKDEGIVEHAVPHIVAKTGACESHDRIFHFDYYGQEAFLVQACQLHQECFLPHFEAVYSINESFRKEHFFDTNNHLSESTLIESLRKDVNLEHALNFIERMLKTVASRIIERAPPALEYFGFANLEALLKPFERITYAQAAKISGMQGADFSPEDEKKIMAAVGKGVYITDHPEEIKFFSTRRNGKTAVSADLYLDGCGEAAGITETEKNSDLLVAQFMRSPMKMARAQYEWYFELHREFDFYQSGFGMGVERLLKYACGMPHIALTVPFARSSQHLNP
ncbi:MAG: amino acid--tRNA ligase-related protein [Candidatus Burarchaeum sp.]|nr:amino acid--tRNA ligase-related protein [Candidatus Burarchaeum sp.]MDO8340019.1 amino acid--tRNA ligase-related protein [Candidatus Burarchaeum sp.]